MLQKGKSTGLIMTLAGTMLLGLCTPVFAEGPEATFKAKCAMCHGADAAGKTPMGAKLNIPDLRSPAVKKQSLAELGQAISKGKNKMPAFEGKLSSAEISQLATYIHDLK
jgi:mono/diheme cytochrome c family protein